MERSISVIIPAYNEEGNLKGTVDVVVAAVTGRFSDYEILIFDDGSQDGTGPLADKLAASDATGRIKVIHNGVNRGFGYNFRRGVELATEDYIGMIPGDNEIAEDSVAAILDAAGKAEIVAAYTVNVGVRPLMRRIVSKTFTTLMNLLFGLRLRYFNGPTVYRRELIQSIPITTSGFAFTASIMVRLIRSGHSYVEVGMHLKPRDYGGSKAFAPSNIVSVISLFTTCFLCLHNFLAACSLFRVIIFCIC